MMEKYAIKYIILEELLTENRVNQAKERYKCIPPGVVDYASSKDPSGNNKYLMWILKQYWEKDVEGWYSLESCYRDDADLDDFSSVDECRNHWSGVEAFTFNSSLSDLISNSRFESSWTKGFIDTVVHLVTEFHRFGQSLKNKDINSYDYDSLNHALAPARLKAYEKELAKDVEKIYEDEDWLIISPKTHQASCIYGSNTQWCVTMKKEPSYYQRYTKDDNYLIFVIKKKENRKWAINTDIKLTSPSEDIEINLPWHREVELGFVPMSNMDIDEFLARRRYSDRKHNEYVEQELIRRYGRSKTTYWNANDDEIGWKRFIEDSKLPEKLQSLLRAIEKRVVITFEKKKRGEKEYEINRNPVRLRKGDKVRLLASGYGLIKGDIGEIIGTYRGAPGRAKDVNISDAGLYLVYVPDRYITSTHEMSNVKLSNGQVVERLRYVIVNGAYLQKIDKPKKR